MASEKSSSMMDWVLFVVTAIITLVLLVFVPQWFWLVLPFPLTYLVKALNVM